MFFKASLVVAATAASMALAQGVTIPDITLNQCAPASVTYTAPEGSYYVALVPANDACTGAPFAEYHDVSSGSVDVAAVNIPAGTQVQAYVTGPDGNEYWSGVITVGDGDASCLGASSAVESSSTSASSASVASATTAPSAYVAPANNVASSVNRSPSSASSGNSDTNYDDTPANAADATPNGASSVTVSLTVLGGALFAAAALF